MAPLIVITTPIFPPVAMVVGVDPVHFGIIMMLNLGIGLVTPPVGSVLFVGSAVVDFPVTALMRSTAPFYLALVAALMLITYVPSLSLWLRECLAIDQLAMWRSRSYAPCRSRPRDPANPLRYFNSSPEIIRPVVMMYVRFPLSLRNVEDLLFERVSDIRHETVRYWWNRFEPMSAADIRRQRVSRMKGFRHWKWQSLVA